MCQSCYGTRGGEFHFIVNQCSTAIDCSSENVGEAEHIVYLVGVIAAAGGLKDKKVWEVTLMKERGFLVIFINGIEIARFSNLSLTNPGMGFYAGPKNKLEAYGVRYSPISYDNKEESD